MKKLILICLFFASIINAKTTISEKSYKQLQKANKFIELKQYTKAKNILDKLLSSKVNDMSKSYAYQSLANIYISKDEYKKVTLNYEKILKLNALEIKDLNTIKFSLSQIYLSISEYKRSIKYSKQSLDSINIKKSKVLENLALAYYYNKQYKTSIPYIKETIKAKKKKESWYRMLYSGYIELKDYKNAISTLKYMVKHYTNEESYWMQLVSIYQNTRRYKESLATIELAYKKDIINKKKNIMYFVNILLQNKLYNKAGIVIENSLNKNILKDSKRNFNLLISAYINAKNYKKSIPYLKSSTYAKTDKYQLILGNIFYNNSDYPNTIKVLEKHKFNKNTRISGQKDILIALSFYELDNPNSTKKYLKKAILNKYEKRRASNIAKSLSFKI
jgi:tetratricopeptide (TPR) repeat protein